MHNSLASDFDEIWRANKRRSTNQDEGPKDKKPKSQHKMGDFMSGAADFTQKVLDRKIVDFVVLTNQAYRVVESSEFRELVLIGNYASFNSKQFIK